MSLNCNDVCKRDLNKIIRRQFLGRTERVKEGGWVTQRHQSVLEINYYRHPPHKCGIPRPRTILSRDSLSVANIYTSVQVKDADSLAFNVTNLCRDIYVAVCRTFGPDAQFKIREKEKEK